MKSFSAEAGAVFIANRWEKPSGGESIAVVDPSTGQEFTRIARGGAPDIDRAVVAARHAFEGTWGRLAPHERGRLLMKLAQAILEHQDALAALESRDCGKPTKQAANDVLFCARYFEFYAGACDKVHGETLPAAPGMTVLTLREPFGVTGHIIPWNYPLQIFARSLGGSLAAGNACVVKPAEDACLSLLALAELVAAVGFPEGALNIVPGYGREAGAALAAHTGIDHISFTGSAATGTQVAQAAAVHHRPVTLELGGKSPQVVFADADFDAMLPVIVNAAIQNAGQTCSAGTRLLVEAKVYDEVLARVGAAFKALRVGPSEADLDVGPLIRKSQLERVRGFLELAQKDGLKVAAQGSVGAKSPAGGYYVAPTLLADVPVDHRIAQEEVFGPVLAAMRFASEDEALRLANATRYGLTAGVWTRDGARQWRVARGIRSGQVFVNNYGAGGGVELPFGGMKSSGHGREKGMEGLYSFTQLKTVAIKHD